VKEDNRLKQGLRVTYVGVAANTVLVLLKFLAGILGRSTAIIADAVHSVSDFGSDIVVIAGLKLGERPADDTHHYGHGKIETLSAVILGFVLILTGLGILVSGIAKMVGFFKGIPLAKPGWIALYAALASIIVKEWLYHYTVKVGRKIDSPSVVANAVHHRSDALSSLGVLLGIGGAILLGQKWRVLDPAAAVIVSFFILKVAFKIIKESLNELLEASLGAEVEQEIVAIALQVEGACQPHNLKTRKIGNKVAIDLHIYVDRLLNIEEAHTISTQVENRLKARFGDSAIIYVHVEPEGD
jgi:cation diffusion facilitator family transporter